MARCDQGYLCRVCGQEVEEITDSELYLRYVIGEVDPELLHVTPECHLRCAPIVAQFIDDPRFGISVEISGEFSASELDPAFVAARKQLIKRGYDRLWDIRKERNEPLTVAEYCLPDCATRWC